MVRTGLLVLHIPVYRYIIQTVLPIYYDYFLTLNAVPNESEQTTLKVYKEHLLAKQMWTKPHIYLNGIQEEAAQLSFTNPFRLIQGPPGTQL